VIVTLLAAVKTQDPSTIWPCAQSEKADTSVISAIKSTFMSLEWVASLAFASSILPE
jgi:hypothetical protein